MLRSRLRGRRCLRSFVAALRVLSIAGVIAIAGAGSALGQATSEPADTAWAPDGPEPPYAPVPPPFEAPDEGSAGRLGLSKPAFGEGALVLVAPESVIGVGTPAPEALPIPRDFGPPVEPAITTVDGRHVVVFSEGFGSVTEGGGASASPSNTPTPSVSDGESTGEDEAFDSRLRAVDLETGKDLWDPIPLDRVSRTGVTVAGGLAIVGDSAGTITAVDLVDGSVAWTADAGGALYNRIAAGGDLVVASTQSSRQTAVSISAFDLEDGTRVWRHDTETGLQAASPMLVGDAVVAAVTDPSGRASVVALTADDGGERWTTRLTSQVTLANTLAATDDTVVALDARGEVYSIALADGRIRWSFAENRTTVRGGPVVSDGAVVFGAEDGAVVAVDLVRGRLVWRGQPDGAAPVRSISVVQDRLVVVRGGRVASVISLRHEDGPLLDEVSPTVADPLKIVGLFAVAAAPLGVVLIFGGGWLRRRFPPDVPAEDVGADLDADETREEDE